MPYGLKEEELQQLVERFATNQRIDRVVLYGSRAKGNYRPFSDVDLALVGDGLSRSDINALHAALDESSLPYQFDISILDSCKNEALKDHIRRRGIIIYQRKAYIDSPQP